MNEKKRMYELLKHRNYKEIHTTNLFEDIETLLEENKKQKEVVDKAIDKLYSIPIEATRQEIIDIARETLHILKEVSDE